MGFAVSEILVFVNTKCFPELALWKCFDIKSSFENNSFVMPERAPEDNLSFLCHSSNILPFKALVQTCDYKAKILKSNASLTWKCVQLNLAAASNLFLYFQNEMV